jgi:hypothetical protein
MSSGLGFCSGNRSHSVPNNLHYNNNIFYRMANNYNMCLAFWQGRCSNTYCHLSHSLPINTRYKIVMCSKVGHCNHASKCHYAHSNDEMQFFKRLHRSIKKKSKVNVYTPLPLPPGLTIPCVFHAFGVCSDPNCTMDHDRAPDFKTIDSNMLIAIAKMKTSNSPDDTRAAIMKTNHSSSSTIIHVPDIT